MMNSRWLPKLQRGQAMVEYAIILIVMTLLVAGGLELALAAYNGHLTGQAARAGAVEWSERLAQASYLNGSTGKFLLADGIGIGDHDPATGIFRRPHCNPLNDPMPYDDGLPDGSIVLDEKSETHVGNKIYLYNPLPIDITDCVGKDDNATPLDAADDVQRVLALLTGRGQPGDADYYSGMPKLNQAIYAQYESVCEDAGAIPNPAIISCKDFDSANPQHRRLLKLPGWLDPADGAVKLWTYVNAVLETIPKMTFALQCASYASSDFVDCDSSSLPADVCWTTDPTPMPLACNIKVQYRYRHVFESLVLMRIDEPSFVVPAGETQYFNSGAAAAGMLGSELKETSDPVNPGIGAQRKARKDFCGSYSTTSVITPPNANAQAGRGGLISGASWLGGVLTIDVDPSFPHGLATGDLVRVNGFVPKKYNGVFQVTVVDPDTFTYAMTDDPGGVVDAGYFVTGFANVESIKAACP